MWACFLVLMGVASRALGYPLVDIPGFSYRTFANQFWLCGCAATGVYLLSCWKSKRFNNALILLYRNQAQFILKVVFCPAKCLSGKVFLW
jgi:hypothetical protein